MKWFASLIVSVLLIMGVSAKADEPVQLSWFMPGGQPCAPDPSRGPGYMQNGTAEFFLENLTDGLLPNPAPIVWSAIWVEGGGQDATATSNLAMAVDPQQWYAKSAGYPVYQKSLIKTFKTLNAFQLTPNSEWSEKEHPYPVLYHSGDAIAWTPECVSPTGKTIFPYAMFKILAPADIQPLPFLVNFPIDNMTTTGGGPQGYSLRSLLPPLSANISQIRIKVFLPNGAAGGRQTRLTNMSVGVQASPGSPNTEAVPIETKFNQFSGSFIQQQQWIWTDWTPFTALAGQSLIVIADQFSPSSDGNTYWARNCASGYGAWYATLASYNQAAMPGTPTWQPGCSHVMFQVQVR